MDSGNEAENATPENDAEIELAQRFQTVQDQLLAAQNDLAALTVAAASNPVLEDEVDERRTELLAKRDALLASWGRVALTWTLRGGKVKLQRGDGEASTPANAPVDVENTLKTLNRVLPIPEKRPAPAKTEAATAPPKESPPPKPKPREPSFDHTKLYDVLVKVGRPPGEITDSETLWDELYKLLEVAAPNETAIWPEFPKDAQKAMVGMCVSRARHIQDEMAERLRSPDLDTNLDRIFSAMTAYSKREQPGFVFGLQRHHHPVGDSWASDGHRWWDELVNRLPDPGVLDPQRALERVGEAADSGDNEGIVEAAMAALDAGVAPDDPAMVTTLDPHLDLLRKHAKFKRVRKAIRDTRTADEEFTAEMEGDTPKLPAKWPFKARLKTKNVAILGDLPEEARARVEKIFAFHNTEWVGSESEDGMRALPRSIRAGTLDMVIALRRFVSPEKDQLARSAANIAGVPWVNVETGYTVDSIRIALEQEIGTA